jgi:hypothetical protein
MAENSLKVIITRVFLSDKFVFIQNFSKNLFNFVNPQFISCFLVKSLEGSSAILHTIDWPVFQDF